MSITTRAPYGAETFYMPEEAFRLNPIARAFGQQPLLYGGGKGKGGKGGKAILGAVISIAAPIAAPAIASSLAASTTIGAAISSTIGTAGFSALTGAALGATGAALQGGNVGRGAAFGGIGGYLMAPSTPAPAGMATQAGVQGGVTGGYTGQTLAQNVAAAPTIATAAEPGLMAYGTLGAQPTMAAQGAQTFANVPSATFANVQPGIQGYGVNVPVTAGAPATQPGLAAYGTLTPPTAAPTVNTITAGSAPSFTPQANTAAMTGQQVQAATSGIQYNAAGQAINPATGAPYTFTEAIKTVPSAVQAKFSDPRALADLTLRAAGAIYAAEMGGGSPGASGLSPEEQQLLQAQMDELNTLRKENQALFNQRLEQAQSLIGESKYFDPEYFGLQRARRAQVAGARAKRAGLRGLTGTAREAEARRFDLATGRDVGTAYDVGYGQGVAGRLQTRQAGVSMMPSAYPSTSGEFTNLSNAYGSAMDRQRVRARDEAAGAGDIFRSVFG